LGTATTLVRGRARELQIAALIMPEQGFGPFPSQNCGLTASHLPPPGRRTRHGCRGRGLRLPLKEEDRLVPSEGKNAPTETDGARPGGGRGCPYRSRSGILGFVAHGSGVLINSGDPACSWLAARLRHQNAGNRNEEEGDEVGWPFREEFSLLSVWTGSEQTEITISRKP
jgi:hypothetical protein